MILVGDMDVVGAPLITLDTLPPELLVQCCVTAASAAALGSTCRNAHGPLLQDADGVSSSLWQALAARELGPEAMAIAATCARRQSAAASSTRSGPRRAPTGPQLYATAVRLRHRLANSIEIVSGSVADVADGFSVVACPCLGTLDNFGIGAQGAVRRAAGGNTERAASQLPLPLAPLSATLVDGGRLADAVAFCVTSPPTDVRDAILWQMMMTSLPADDSSSGRRGDKLESQVSETLHTNLLTAVRVANYSSVAMPTLGTGGMGYEVSNVTHGFMIAVLRDAQQHPEALIRVRLACFEQSHVPVARMAREQVLRHLFHGCVETS